MSCPCCRKYGPALKPFKMPENLERIFSTEEFHQNPSEIYALALLGEVVIKTETGQINIARCLDPLDDLITGED